MPTAQVLHGHAGSCVSFVGGGPVHERQQTVRCSLVGISLLLERCLPGGDWLGNHRNNPGDVWVLAFVPWVLSNRFGLPATPSPHGGLPGRAWHQVGMGSCLSGPSSLQHLMTAM